MPWQNSYAAEKEFTGACMKMGWKTFPNNIHPPGLYYELCLWRNIQKESVQNLAGPLFLFLLISLFFILFTVMIFYCSVYKHNWSEIDIWGMGDYIQLYLF